MKKLMSEEKHGSMRIFWRHHYSSNVPASTPPATARKPATLEWTEVPADLPLPLPELLLPAVGVLPGALVVLNKPAE